ncbi:hypothetical protein [Streptomyces sp. CRN 30]|nr:hypothetical protein [Streptomyces sp. CRN 30]
MNVMNPAAARPTAVSLRGLGTTVFVLVTDPDARVPTATAGTER